MVEPQLLRRMRLRLAPAVDVGAEADLWFSDVISSRGADSIVLDRSVAVLLRASLRNEPNLLAQALDEIEYMHRYLPETLRLEERVIRIVLEGGGTTEIERVLAPAVRTLWARGDQARSLAHWALRALPRADPEVRHTAAARTMALLSLTYVPSRRLLPEDRYDNANLARIAWALPPSLTRDDVGVELTVRGLRFAAPDEAQNLLSLPRTTPALVEAQWFEGNATQTAILEATADKQYELWSEVSPVILRTLTGEEYRLEPDRRGVMLLGRFTEGRISVLERLREELRKRGYFPIVVNFDKPETKDFTETVRLLASLSKFVIADITNPKHAPLELQATVPEIMVPFRPIIEEGEKPFAVLQDLWIKHPDWVFEPIYYSSVDALIGSLDEKIIQPAEARFVELLKRKAETMGGEHV
jgi:hypothetical protein